MKNKINLWIEKIEEFILSISVITMAIILIGNVLSRSIFKVSWSFAEEVGQILVIITTFFGVGYAARKNKHINMSAIYDLLPKKGRKVLMTIISGGTSITLFYLAYLALQYTIRVKELERVSPALEMPMFYLYGIVTLGLALGGLEYLITFINNLTKKEIYISSEVIEKN